MYVNSNRGVNRFQGGFRQVLKQNKDERKNKKRKKDKIDKLN